MNKKNLFKSMMILGSMCFVTTAFAQDCNDFANFPGGEEEGKKVHVLYRDLMDKENFEEAFPMWEKLYTHSAAGHPYHYIDGVTLHTDLALKTDEAVAEANEAEEVDEVAITALEEKAEAYKQKVVDIYESRLACEVYKDKGTVLEAMAYSMSEVSYQDFEKTLATYKAAVEENGNNTSPYILAYYADHVIWMYGNDLTDKETARNVYLTLEAIKDANADNEEYSDNWEYVEEYYKDYEGSIFDGAYFLKKLRPVYEQDADNPDVYRPILEKLLEKGCSKNEPFVRELIVKDSIYIAKKNAALAEEDKRNNPDRYGRTLMLQGDNEGALPYFEKAIAKEDLSPERRANSNFYLAGIYHRRGGSSNFAKARTYYEAAAKLKPGWGEPYYQIGVLYASSGPLCGPGTGWKSQVVIWPAMDMWNKAINSGDAEAAAKAKKKIAYYRQFLPTTEDAFQQGKKNGGSYFVPCWIQRSTTIRLRNQY